MYGVLRTEYDIVIDSLLLRLCSGNMAFSKDQNFLLI